MPDTQIVVSINEYTYTRIVASLEAFLAEYGAQYDLFFGPDCWSACQVQ